MEELVLRKTTSQFIEKIFDFYNMHVNHDIFKKLISNEISSTINTRIAVRIMAGVLSTCGEITNDLIALLIGVLL